MSRKKRPPRPYRLSKSSVVVSFRMPVELHAKAVELAGEMLRDDGFGPYRAGDYRPLRPGETMKQFLLEAVKKEAIYRRQRANVLAVKDHEEAAARQ